MFRLSGFKGSGVEGLGLKVTVRVGNALSPTGLVGFAVPPFKICEKIAGVGTSRKTAETEQA